MASSEASTAPPLRDGYVLDEDDRKAAKIVHQMEDGDAFVQFSLAEDNIMVIYHTFCPPSARGKGIAGILCDEAFALARSRSLRVKATCTYVAQRYIPKHPEHKDILCDA